MVLVAAALTAVTVQPPEDGRFLPWALSVVCTALAAVAVTAWRREVKRGDRLDDRIDALTKSMIEDVVPAMTRNAEATNRATEAVTRSLDRERR